MDAASGDILRIPYGTGAGSSAGLLMAIDRRQRVPLRLNSGSYPFAEPPDLVRLTRIEERLDFLREHLKSLCGIWDKLPRAFLDVYFRHIARCIEENRRELEAASRAMGGLFDPRDWSFSALRPLPQAQLPAGNAAVRVDCAFWTGDRLVGVEILGNATPRRTRRAELDLLRQSSVTVVEIAAAELQDEGEHLLAQRLPAPFTSFWRDEALPSSPFGPLALDDILVESEDD